MLAAIRLIALRHSSILTLLLAVLAGHAEAAGTNIEIGILPNVSARLLMTQYEPMRAYLAQQLGRPVSISTAPNWKEFYARTKRGEYHIAIVAANVARLMQSDLGHRAILSFEPRIKALLVGRATDPLGAIKQLRGQALGLANPASLVAFESLRWLEQQGLRRGEDYRLVQARGDDSIGNMLLRGEVAMGAMSMGEFLAHPQEVRERLAIHQVVSEVPGFIVCVAPGVEAGLADTLKSALLAMTGDTESGREFQHRSGIRAIIPVNAAELERLDIHTGPTRQALD